MFCIIQLLFQFMQLCPLMFIFPLDLAVPNHGDLIPHSDRVYTINAIEDFIALNHPDSEPISTGLLWESLKANKVR